MTGRMQADRLINVPWLLLMIPIVGMLTLDFALKHGAGARLDRLWRRLQDTAGTQRASRSG